MASPTDTDGQVPPKGGLKSLTKNPFLLGVALVRSLFLLSCLHTEGQRIYTDTTMIE
jgi:hypothetical protein